MKKLIDIFGNKPQVKIIEYLSKSNYDYSLSNISEKTFVNRITTKIVVNDLVKMKIIVNTRKLGKSKLYQLQPNIKTIIENLIKVLELRL